MNQQQKRQQLLLAGMAMDAAGKPEEALKHFKKMIALNPNDDEAHYYCGNIRLEMKQYERALEHYTQVVKVNPNLAPVYNNMAFVLHELKRDPEALVCASKAIVLNPNYSKAYNNLGLAFHGVKRGDDALVAYKKAIALEPDFAEAYANYAELLLEMRRYDEALEAFEKAMALTPDKPYLLGNFLHIKMMVADWRGLDDAFAALAKKIASDEPATTPFPMLAMPLSPAQQLVCAQSYTKHNFPPQPRLWKGKPYAHERIRLAYISADFREHAVSYLMAGVFEKGDRSRFEYYAISLMPQDHSAIGQRVKAVFEHFTDVSAKNDKEIAELLRDLEIDVAVDLMGVTTYSKPGIFTFRPCPVHINYLGYPATRGCDYMDYIIADPFIIPPESQQYYSEKIIYMPDCFQANDDKRAASLPSSRAAQGLPEVGFIFCSFNNTFKICPAFFDIWMRLLKAVPGSVLWLLGSEAAQSNLRKEAAARGVEPSRLVFAGGTPYPNHLARLVHADLSLDNLPFNAGTTASDILWAGVPLITCAGETFAGRMAGSLLTALKLPELITYNLKAYETLALELATQPQKLSAIRDKLKKRRASSPLFDTARFTTHLENAYFQAWKRAQTGLSPDHISINAGN